MNTLLERIHPVVGALSLANAAAIVGDRVSFKNFRRCLVLVALAPASGTDTLAITLKQSKTVDDSPSTEKALAFTKAWKVAAFNTSDVPAEIAVTGNSITTSAAAAKELYLIEVKAEDLDLANDFDCFRVDLTDPGSVSTPACILHLMYEPRQSGPIHQTAIVD